MSVFPRIHYAGIGSRMAPPPILDMMTAIARRLQEQGLVLRSGGAQGSDEAFARGATVKEIYLPEPGWRGSTSPLHPLALLYPTWEAAREIARKHHPRWSALTGYERNLHTRNVYQVLGVDLKTPSEFVVCWTSDGQDSGGTGQALRIARKHGGVEIYNLFDPAALPGLARRWG